MYAAVMMFYICILPYLGNGPFVNPGGGDKWHCRYLWLTKLLYIDILIPTTQLVSGFTGILIFKDIYFSPIIKERNSCLLHIRVHRPTRVQHITTLALLQQNLALISLLLCCITSVLLIIAKIAIDTKKII